MQNDTILKTLEKIKQVYNQGDYDYAHTLCMQVLSFDSFNKEVIHYLHLSNIGYARGAKKNLIVKFVSRLASLVYSFLGMLNSLFEDYTKALKMYEKAINTSPFSVKIYYKMADIFKITKDFESAVNIYNEILTVSVNDLKALKGLGEVYLKMNNLVSARECLLKAERVAPSDGEVQSAMKNLAALETMEQF